MAKLPNLTSLSHHTKLTIADCFHIANGVTKHYHRLPSGTWARLTWHIVSDDHAPEPFERWQRPNNFMRSKLFGNKSGKDGRHS